MANAGPAIRYRLATDVFPELRTPEQLEALRVEIEASSTVRQIARKQKDTGAWGGNLLGVAPNKTAGIKDVGTIPQFRHLVEMGVHGDFRALKLGSRLLFRLLSRDPDPKLLFEYEKYGAAELGAEPWIREVLREAAAAALAHSGCGEDPRVRGAAHKIANSVSAFLRSETAASPFVKSGRAWILDPAAYPPTIFSITLLAYLPAVQRERAGLMERLGGYLAVPPPKKAFTAQAGKKSLKPTFLLLGDPLHVSATGVPDDLPFALHWAELLARIGALQQSTSFQKFWPRLLKDCDSSGVWHPKGLRGLPKSASPWAYHAFPLEADTKRAEARQADVTFRMALIARLAGWELVRS
ncbi:MAG: hypothetical protein A2085_00040 [Gemmatimonadetes bacterium GWC2_71_10]|nr:MAG: hypothetical protein A2085_00040 [Gemmatimonadetes bacterium GWC2_71_10]